MKNDLETRTKRFALSIVELVGKLPHCKASGVIGYQLLKSGTSIGANYREAARAQSSRDDFIHKIGICAKETSETEYWLELAQGADLIALTVSEGRCERLRNCWLYSWRAAGQQNHAADPIPRSAFRIFCTVRRKTPSRTIDARNPPFPSNAVSAPGPKARSIQ
jgi:four helix bundle protein